MVTLNIPSVTSPLTWIPTFWQNGQTDTITQAEFSTNLTLHLSQLSFSPLCYKKKKVLFKTPQNIDHIRNRVRLENVGYKATSNSKIPWTSSTSVRGKRKKKGQTTLTKRKRKRQGKKSKPKPNKYVFYSPSVSFHPFKLALDLSLNNCSLPLALSGRFSTRTA